MYFVQRKISKGDQEKIIKNFQQQHAVDYRGMGVKIQGVLYDFFSGVSMTS